MTGLQRFIKYAAIAFGIYLSLTIAFVFLSIARSLTINSNEEFENLIENDVQQYYRKEYKN